MDCITNAEEQNNLLKCIRDTQIELHSHFVRRQFEESQVDKYQALKTQKMFSFKQKLKKYYLQHFYIEQILNPKNVDPKIKDFKIAETSGPKINYNIIDFHQIELKDICLSNELSDLTIDFITYSVIPSYFNFFITHKNVEDFSEFIEYIHKNDKTTDHKMFFKYTRVIYSTPHFLNFCANTFQPVFLEYLHKQEKDIIKPEELFDKLFKSIENNLGLCPPLFHDLVCSEKTITHFHENFFLQLFKCPARFSSIPEYYEFPKNFFDKFNNFLFTLDKSGKNYISLMYELFQNSSKNSNIFIDDKSPRFFTSFDIQILQNNKQYNYIDYTYVKEVYMNEKEQPTPSICQPNPLTEVFRELLKLSDILPSNIKFQQNFSLYNLLMELLVKTGNFHHQIERHFLLNKTKEILEIGKYKFKDLVASCEEMIKNYDYFEDKIYKIKHDLDLLISIDYSFSILCNHTRDLMFLLQSTHKRINPYDLNEISDICNNPETLIQHMKTITQDRYNYYVKRVNNLRFSHFLEKYKDLNRLDALFHEFIESKKDEIIQKYVDECPNLSKLTSPKNISLLNPILESLKKTLESNGSPLEILDLFMNTMNEARVLVEDNPEPIIASHLFYICLILVNPQKFISLISYLDTFFFKPLNGTNNNKLSFREHLIEILSNFYQNDQMAKRELACFIPIATSINILVQAKLLPTNESNSNKSDLLKLKNHNNPSSNEIIEQLTTLKKSHIKIISDSTLLIYEVELSTSKEKGIEYDLIIIAENTLNSWFFRQKQDSNSPKQIIYLENRNIPEKIKMKENYKFIYSKEDLTNQLENLVLDIYDHS